MTPWYVWPIGVLLLAALITTVGLFLAFLDWLTEDEDGRFKHQRTLSVLGTLLGLFVVWALGTAFLQVINK